MKTTIQTVLLGVLIIGGSGRLHAQPFDSGSTGKDGALNITQDTTLDLPPDGTFHFTTVIIAADKKLKFNRNALNTPVYLLAQGDVQIEGIIDVSALTPDGRASGKAGPGGFDGGEGGFGGTGFGGTGNGGDVLGPGGGRGGEVNVFPASGRFAEVYGNASLIPLVGGSGGGGWPGNPGQAGGGGGGAILVASTTKITANGSINAGGARANFYGGNGSGGAIRLVAPVVSGSGTLSTKGGGDDNSPGGPTPGRVRLDCLDSIAARSLKARDTLPSRGSHMVVFPSIVPRLDITEAAGQSIPAPAANPVSIQLPQGASVHQVVKVQATGFATATPIRVVVAPSDRASTSYDVEIPASDAGPVTVPVNVVIPADSTSRIHAWTR